MNIFVYKLNNNAVGHGVLGNKDTPSSSLR
jgi:hypothetical protein